MDAVTVLRDRARCGHQRRIPETNGRESVFNGAAYHQVIAHPLILSR
jgi:hypothetical protein